MTDGEPLCEEVLADRIVRFVVAGISAFTTRVAPGFHLPGSYAGHPVGADTRADLIYVLGLLIDAGVTEVAGASLESAVRRLLDDLPADDVEGFSSYRVAETVHRLGGLSRLSAEQAVVARTASRSPGLLAALAEERPRPRRNFHVVLARCLWAHGRLEGGEPDGLDEAMHRARDLFSSTPTGWINDAREPWTQYDIYTPDMYLLAEPFASSIGPPWLAGLTRVITDLDDLVQPGGAVVWGRSVGVLSLAMTIELAAVSLQRRLGPCPDRWRARLAHAVDDLADWFSHGVVTAHQHRSSDRYRGASRRLQLTLDVYGKLLLAAQALRNCPPFPRHPVPAGAQPPANRLVVFDARSRSGAWTVRSRDLCFVLPVMRGESSGYLPVPRRPRLFEQSVSGPPTMIPTVLLTSSPLLVPAGPVRRLDLDDRALTVEHHGWAPVGAAADDRWSMSGRRTATYRTRGRTLVVHEELEFDTDRAVTVGLAVGDNAEQPLRLATEPTGSHLTVDTEGMAEWYGHWGAVSRVQQVEFICRQTFAFTWRLTRGLRIASTDLDHQYNQALYGPLVGAAAVLPAGDCDAGLTDRLRGMDVLHLAWPERWSGADPKRTAAAIRRVRAAGVRVVWTQHNLLPHRRKDRSGFESYALWAMEADLVLHHSEYGKAVAQEHFAYGAHTRHLVIPHGAWTAHYDDFRSVTRAEVEQEEGWPSAKLRLAVIGQPRAEKDVRSVVKAVEACNRDDVHLVARAPTGTTSADSRITVEYGHLPDRRFRRRMAAFDAIVLPFTSEGMLATGTVFDCIGGGTAALTSDWGFLNEVLGDVGIRYGRTANDLAACIDNLTDTRLTQARIAMTGLRRDYDWSAIAKQTLAAMEDL
ncbi:glycosyltransferase [Micromonospora aurantiaca]|uniref:Glycosyltransferase family 1 protein n=1 Tax=Micromonospora aurantiaca (nom. illeg.) TaxID=47850 RepID=A0A6N3K799_9ACTN|nr:glycosyltransferase [Micromonospora aurantiaca]AXH93542.1 glycosyltransferase family 1 protein [Micromonospora aurantiaca]